MRFIEKKVVHQILLKTHDVTLKGIKVVFECKGIVEKLTLADRIWTSQVVILF